MADKGDFEVLLAPCVVTGKFEKVIRAKLQDLPLPEGGVAEIFGSFSEEGLGLLQAALAAAPHPLEKQSVGDVRHSNPYQWSVVFRDGSHVQQYHNDGTEVLFSSIHLPNVDEFWVVPRDPGSGLPGYALIRSVGFVRCAVPGAPQEPLTDVEGAALPIPDGDWEWHYYRRVWEIVGARADGLQDQGPERLVQVVGWRVGATIFEIGIERDGSWQVWRKEPLEAFEEPAEGSGQIIVAGVRIIDALGV